MNYFSSSRAAALYAQGRPFFHELVIERLREIAGLGPGTPVARALDVGCGTGLSTIALTRIARAVVGVDVSPAMLSGAARHPAIHYAAARAEAVPFAGGAFDLATVSSAFHWLDRDRFFAEMRRALRPNATLVIYENGFTGRIRERPDFEPWLREVYLHSFPTPTRHHPFDPGSLVDGFALIPGSGRYDNDVPMTAEQLVRYFLSQSNFLAALETGDNSLEDLAAWLRGQIMPFFRAPGGHETASDVPQTCRFTGFVWCLRRR